ncbi:MAG: hypothetical protein M1511_04675 [Deltaproteobacteria bacterium]|nr:hypothetical protein [Deltaproteobacteria bacterium]
MTSYSSTKSGFFSVLLNYFANLKDQRPYWRKQALFCGVILALVVGVGALFAILTLSSVFGGGNISFSAPGSPGPVEFRHYTHMWFKNGKYKDCKTCHEGLFASQHFGTYVLRALKDSPPIKTHIGKKASTLFVPGTITEDEEARVDYEVPRACATCATGSCHDGKESFSRFECLGCHKTK